MSENEQMNKFIVFPRKCSEFLHFHRRYQRLEWNFHRAFRSFCFYYTQFLCIYNIITNIIQFFQNIQNISIETKTTKHKQCVMLFSATGANAFTMSF